MEHPTIIRVELPALDRLIDALRIGHPNQMAEILTKLTGIEQTLQEIKMTDAEVKAILQKVDETTTKLGTNLDTIATVQANEGTVLQTISDEIDALVLAKGSNGISDATASALTQIADKLQASSDKADALAAATQAQVPVLNAIAAKGAPTVPPAPEPPVV